MQKTLNIPFTQTINVYPVNSKCCSWWSTDTVPPRNSRLDSKSVVVLKLLPLEDTEMYCICCYFSVLLKCKRTMKMLHFLHFPISKQIIFSESSYFKKHTNRRTLKVHKFCDLPFKKLLSCQSSVTDPTLVLKQ